VLAGGQQDRRLAAEQEVVRVVRAQGQGARGAGHGGGQGQQGRQGQRGAGHDRSSGWAPRGTPGWYTPPPHGDNRRDRAGPAATPPPGAPGERPRTLPDLPTKPLTAAPFRGTVEGWKRETLSVDPAPGRCWP